MTEYGYESWPFGDYGMGHASYLYDGWGLSEYGFIGGPSPLGSAEFCECGMSFPAWAQLQRIYEPWEYAFPSLGAPWPLLESMFRECMKVSTDGSLVGVESSLTKHSVKLYVISGVTRDLNGLPLSYCTVRLIPTDGHGPVQESVSDGNGNYSFYVPDGAKEYFVTAFKAGTPSIFGRTDKDLKGVAV